MLQQKCLGFVVLVGKGYFLQNSKISLNLFVKDSCLFTFCWANFFSCSARISLRLACFSFSLLSSSSSLARCLRHSLMYSLNCSSNSPFLAPWRAFKKLPSPLISINILMNWCSLKSLLICNQKCSNILLYTCTKFHNIDRKSQKKVCPFTVD